MIEKRQLLKVTAFSNQLSGNKFLNLSLLTCKTLKVVKLSSSNLTSSNNLYLLNDR